MDLEGAENELSGDMLGKLSASSVASHVTADNISLPVYASAALPECMLCKSRADEFMDF